MPEAPTTRVSNPSAERKAGVSKPRRWKALGALIQECMTSGFGRPARQLWEAKDLAAEFGCTEHAVRNWCRGDYRPDRTLSEALLRLFARGEAIGLAQELAVRFWAAYTVPDAGTSMAELRPDISDNELRTLLDSLVAILEGPARQSPYAVQKGRAFKLFLIGLDWREATCVERRIKVGDYLRALERQAEAHNFLRYFELQPLHDVLAACMGAVPAVTPTRDDRVPNAWADDETRYREVVEPTLASIQAAQAWLRSRDCTLPAHERPEVGAALAILNEQLSDLEIHVPTVNAARARLQSYEPNLIRRVVLQVQVLLGRDAHLLPPLTIFRDLPEPWCPEVIVIPGGTFWMGSPKDEITHRSNESPRHEVSIPPFAVGRFTVTFEEYDRFCAETGRPPPRDEGWGRGRMPIINVSWEDAQIYCEWLSGRTEARYRLLSEAEWEYTARAGTTTPFWQSNEITWIEENIDGTWTGIDYVPYEKRGTTVPVDDRSFSANPWGLYHVHGNVREWVQDVYCDSYVMVPSDGPVAVENRSLSIERVVRGGSWQDNLLECRAARRHSLQSDSTGKNVGFRVARMVRLAETGDNSS